MTNKEYILPDDIKSILAKYYDGLTSIEEERILRQYFDENRIPESNNTDKALLSFVNDDEISVFPSTDIWEKIRDHEKNESNRRRNIRVISSIAASFFVVFSLCVWYLLPSKQDNKLTDSYSNPEEAYKMVQKYLGFVSTKLSYAYTEMKPVEKLSIPSETMQSFSSLDKSIEYLKQLDRIETSVREIERFSIISDIINVSKN